MFAQHVHQLHADGGADLLRDWQTLQTAAPPADETQTNAAMQVDSKFLILFGLFYSFLFLVCII